MEGVRILVKSGVDESNGALSVFRSLFVDKSDNRCPDWRSQAGSVGKLQLTFDEL